MVKHPRTTLAAATALAAVAGAALATTPASAVPSKARAASFGVRLAVQDAASPGTAGGVTLTAGYGSAVTPVPGRQGLVYALTDRGPNVDGPVDDSKVSPLPGFDPAIGEFALVGGHAHLLRTIPLRAADGTAYNGLVNPQADTGESMYDLNGDVLPTSPYGYDSEGLVALPDGTFWVSDEYGPFITHFDASGRQLQRLSPYDGTLPAELAERDPNKGMEGLTITPDGSTLVGAMQAALNAPDGAKSKKISALRIVTVSLRTGETHEYVNLLHNTGGANTTVSEIAALNDHQFLVDERDSAFEPGANKKLWKIDLDGATDIGPASTVPDSTYDASAGGLLVGGSTVEAIAGTGNTDATRAALGAAGITPVSSSLFLDIGGLVSAIDPTGGFYGHDKVEGVAVLDGGRRLVLSDDSDFGVDSLSPDTPTAPWDLQAKILPNGLQDSGEFLEVDMAEVPARFR